MDLNALNDFQLVAVHGGFGRASRASGRSKATLSRRVAELEESLGVRLFERSDRSLELTEAGQLLLARIEGPMREVAEAVAAARDGLDTPRGRLRVAAPVFAGGARATGCRLPGDPSRRADRSGGRRPACRSRRRAFRCRHPHQSAQGQHAGGQVFCPRQTCLSGSSLGSATKAERG